MIAGTRVTDAAIVISTVIDDEEVRDDEEGAGHERGKRSPWRGCGPITSPAREHRTRSCFTIDAGAGWRR
jgi:hypothetical protein